MGSATLCSVSFVDRRGVRHTTQVAAANLYEAAILGIHLISQQWAEEPAPLAKIEVERQPPSVPEQTTLKQVRDWVHAAGRTASEAAQKERLKFMLV